MNRKSNVVLVVLLLLLTVVMTAQAQKATLDPTADPNYGTWPLGEYPDPFVMTLDAGGDISASDADVGAGCTGFMTSQPDMVLEFDGGADLRVFFASEGDTTLIMNLPDGTFLCNDDTAGANPVIDVPNAEAGSYAVWFGTFSSGSLIPGHFVATTGDSMPFALMSSLLGSATGAVSAPTSPTSPTSPTNTGDGLSSSGTGTFGSLALAAGFTPDPTEVEMAAGGPVDVTSLNVGDACRGFVASAPDVTVAYEGQGDVLRVFFDGTGDTTLVVQLPNGTYLCNDDFPGGLDPLVDVSAPESGAYSIWVGTFSESSLVPGTLYLTADDTLTPADVGL